MDNSRNFSKLPTVKPTRQGTKTNLLKKQPTMLPPKSNTAMGAYNTFSNGPMLESDGKLKVTTDGAP